MSIYGAFDYMDVLSRASLLAPRDESQAEGVAEVQEDEEEDYLLVLDSVATSTVAESDLPSEIQVSSEASSNSDDDEEEESFENEGVTILPSLPSHEAAAMQLEQQRLQALSMQVQGAPRATRNAHSTISLSTTESRFTDIVHDDEAPSSVSSLSLSMSSLPSSGFSEEIVFEEDSAAAVSFSSQDSATSSDDESTLVKDVEKSVAPKLPAPFSPLSSKKNNGPWYSHLQTEQDWEAFRSECLDLMHAMGEEAPRDVDEFLAQLIAQEEEMLYTTKKKATFLGMSYETIALIAGAAVVPLVGYALASRNRREKAN